MTEFARPFRLHLADGRIWHGAAFPAIDNADFPNGFVSVYSGKYGSPVTIAISLDALFADLRPGHPLNGARVEWPEGVDA